MIRLPTALRWLTALAASSVAQAAEPPAYPLTVPDTLAQRALACTGCHGPQGRATPDGYVPRIAGKPAGYLHQQLLNFRDGRRRHEGMARLLAPLSDDYLGALAGHFASLDLPHVATPPAPRGSAASMARGRQLMDQGDATRDLPACTRCHGRELTGVAPAIPGLLGLPRDYVIAQFGAWRNGTRQARSPDCMATLAQRLPQQDIVAVADWLAAQPLPADTRPAQALPQALPMRCGSVSP
ncbi:putative cytochrome c [Leptothrix cholodnii SP-6]|uniref:Putative cytochrome c n=1 Tax=Leptothrix cholodnii (strain ATCC 51168 / LMG 8142 / SP-6) TaxID=395495 RepID=B1Y685_LEPCP|nr:c-type cytochrome [Leptothrix cholodnii]ACB33590.1 putative cytochrome c [Leptothrix cholodnii SP-6]